MKRLLRPLLFTLEALLLVVALWMALLQVTWLWVQVAPDQVSSWLKWVSGGRVVVARIELPHNLLLPSVTLHGVHLNMDGWRFQARMLQVQVSRQSHRLRTRLQADNWMLQLMGKAASPDAVTVENLPALQRTLSMAYPHWPVPVETAELTAGVVRTGDWQLVLPGLRLFRHGRDIDGRGALYVVYDRIPVWQGEVSLLGRLDWRNRIVSGTFGARMSRPTRLVDLAPLLQTRWRQGVLQVEWGLRYRQGQPDLNVQVRLQRLAIRMQGQRGIDSLGASLRWREQDGLRHFSIERWMINDKVLVNQAPADVTLDRNSIELSLPALRLASFRPALKNLWPQWDWSATQLDVSGFRLRYQLRPFRLLELKGQVHALEWPATGDWPGLRLADLELAGDHDLIQIQLPKPAVLTWRAWRPASTRIELIDPLVLRRQADLHWQLAPLRFGLDGMPGQLQWQGNAQEGKLVLVVEPERLRRVRRFLPWRVMAPELSQWLRQALVQGSVGPVRLRYEGAWRAMLQPGSTLKVDADVRDAELRFMPQWPALTGMAAHLHFQPYRLSIDVAQAKMSGVRIGRAMARIEGLDRQRIALSVTGVAVGAAERVQTLIMDTPLRYELNLEGVLGEQLDFSGGQIWADLSLWVPLKGYGDRVTAVSVKARVNGVNARVPGGLVAKRLNGQVLVQDNRKVSGRLNGLLFGRPLKVTLSTPAGARRLSVSLSAQAPLSRYLAGARGWLHLDGDVSIPLQKATDVQFQVLGRAQLQENGLPSPLSQIITQRLDLHGHYRDGVLNVSLRAGRMNWVEGQWSRQRGKLVWQQGVVLIGEAPAVVRQFHLHPPDGFVVSLVGEEVDLNAWLEWWKHQKIMVPSVDDDGFVHKLRLAMRADTLRYGSQRFDRLRLNAFSLDAQRVAIRLEADQVDMTGLFLPDNHQLVVAVSRLRIGRSNERAEQACASWHRPDDFKVFFVGRDVELGQYHFDALRFNLYGDSAQIRVESVGASAERGAIQLNGRMLWRYQENTTSLDVHFRSNDVKRFLHWAGFRNPGFSGEKAVVEAHVRWPEAPECVTIKSLQGQLTFRLDDGVIEQARPGLAKVFAVLSVDSLLRNVKATFGTLQYQGMVYSKIEGEVYLKKGWGHVRRIFLDAPALQAELKGGVDLLRRRFDLKAKVTPQIGGALTTLLSVVGLANPLTAIGTYLFLKNIPGANPNLVSYHYHIVGAWANPRIINTDTGEEKEGEVEKDPVDELLEQ